MIVIAEVWRGGRGIRSSIASSHECCHGLVNALCVTDLSRGSPLGLLLSDSVPWQHCTRAAAPSDGPWCLAVLLPAMDCRVEWPVSCAAHCLCGAWLSTGTGDLPEGIGLTSSTWALRTRRSWRSHLSPPGTPVPPRVRVLEPSSQCGCSRLCEGDGKGVAVGRVTENPVQLWNSSIHASLRKASHSSGRASVYKLGRGTGPLEPTVSWSLGHTPTTSLLRAHWVLSAASAFLTKTVGKLTMYGGGLWVTLDV